MCRFTGHFGIIIIACLFTSKINAQCKDQVIHTSGIEVVGETSVKVEQSGKVSVLEDYCPETTPYHVGYSLEDSQSGTGSYIFTFDPPISQARLNFSGISKVVGSTEEIIIYVNGEHYQVKEVGEENNCDDLGIITSKGNIGVPENTSVGGWVGTIIDGPIEQLEIKDTVIVGQPAGALFSLFICPGFVFDLGPDTALCNGETLLLNATAKKATYRWQDGSTLATYKVSEPGTYWVEVTTKDGTFKDSVVVEFGACTDDDRIPRAEHWKEIKEGGG